MKSSEKKNGKPHGKKRMTRRELLKYAALSVPILQAGVASKANASRRGPTKNVILFMTDQERRIQHFPPDWAKQNLPGLTRLKQNGLTFENAFTNACMCSPARSTWMSGYFPAQHGVKYTLEEDMTNILVTPQVELPVRLKNIATVMSAAGFNVVYKGKWHCSKPAGATFVPADLEKYGFSRWDPPDAGANQDMDQEGGGTVDNDGRYMNDTGDVQDGKEGALTYLTSQAATQQPFFMIVSLVNPHDVLSYPDNFGMGTNGFGYPESALVGDINIPATIREDLSTKPTVQQQFLNITKLLGLLHTPQRQRNYLNFYGNLMKSSDSHLVELLDTLEDVDLLEDTLIIRTADHGEMGLTHDGQRQKNFNFYEETMRVPLVYSNPKLYNHALKSKALVSHVDFLPTIASLFDAPLSARSPWQGIDYSSMVLDPSAPPVQDYTVFTYDDFQSGQKTPPYPDPPNHIISIREDRFKFADYYDVAGEVPNQLEMYDRLKDPLETENLAFAGFHRNSEQQKEFERLQLKLQIVKATRLQPLV
jgi:choline-sulfatase